MNKYKLETLRQLVVNNDSDMVLISEHNKNLKTLSFQNQPTEIMKGWWNRTIVRSSYLASSSNSVYEPGGTMIVTHSRASAHTCAAGIDNQQLGRWNYITLKGKWEHYTTIISIYWPKKQQETYMRQTAYTTKRRKVLNTDQTPETLWFADLSALVTEKLEQGHEVIVAGDFNDNLNDNKSLTCKCMERLGLTEILIDAHGTGPPTHNRGSTTIDGVFATRGIRMVKGIYTPFEQSPSDHRWIVLDITEQSLLGKARRDLNPAILRKATSKIPSVKHSFQTLVERKVEQFRLHEKVSILYNTAMEKQSNFDQKLISQYESIEARIQKIIRHADRRCRKARIGKIPASPEQHRLMGGIRILKQIRLRALLVGKPNRPKTKRIKRLIKRYRYKGQTHFRNITDIDTELSNYYREFNKFKKRAHEYRWNYLESIAKDFDNVYGKGVQHHFKILLHREQTKEAFARIRKYEGKIKGGRVGKIQIDRNGTSTIVHDKDTIEKEIIKANKKKLLQAHNTPLRSSTLAELLGEQGDFDKWEEILRGCIRLPKDIDEGLHLWYNYITNMPKHSITDFHWTTEEYFASWSKMKEEKTTLPGIQVAHIKCIDPASKAAEVISKMALIPLLTGYSPNTWRTGIDSMIPKKTNDLRPDKLRLILLMDARFNHNNKLIGKKMMEYGEKHGLLAKEQYGSRQSKSAIEHATNKRIVMDTVRQSGGSAIYIANDAKSCYDRIILMMAYLTMRNYGIPQLAAQSTIISIMNMKHFVRTKFGDSKRYYGGDKWQTKPHGCGQGNGYGPALWACISSPLLHILRNKGYGTIIHHPISQSQMHLSAFAFVDDTDIIQTHNDDTKNRATMDEHNVIQNLYSRTQSGLDLWSHSLASTGGELEPGKTFCVPIISKWKGTHKVLKKKDDNHRIYLHNDAGQPVAIEQKDPNDAFFTLGIWQSPSGDETKQKQHLTTKIEEWGKNMKENSASWKHARLALKATIGRTLCYPLAATSFDEKQCRELQKVYLWHTLGKIGIVRTLSPLIACAPIEYGGLGLMSFEIEQLTKHIEILTRHGPDIGSNTKQLIQATLEYYSLESGLPGDPIQLPPVQYITANTWIYQVLKGLWKHDIKIKSDLKGLYTWCDNDSFIMDQLAKCYSISMLRTINKVRLYMRVVTISDLMSADGRSYDSNILKGFRGNQHPSPSVLRYRWPTLPEPTNKERKLWSSAICVLLNVTPEKPTITRSQELFWNTEVKESSQWLQSLSTRKIYEKTTNNTWHKWKRIKGTLSQHMTRSVTNQYSKEHGQVESIPEDARPISITKCEQYIRPLGRPGMMTIPGHRGSTDTTSSTHHPIGYLESIFCYNIQLNNGLIFTDGSYNEGKATYAILAQPHIEADMTLDEIDCHKMLSETGVVEGHDEDLHSYRAELRGILAAIEFTNKICRDAIVHKGTCTIYCDNKGALSAAFGHKRPTPRWTSYDLLRQIREALDKSPIQWRGKHIKSHQDELTPFQQLDYYAQGNVIVDRLAAEKMRDHPGAQPPSTLTWIPKVNGKIISGNVGTIIKREIYRPIITQRWINILGIPEALSTQCDWKAYYRSIATRSPSLQIQFTKYTARILPVGKNLVRRKHSSSNKCPCCGMDEDHDHLIRCTHPQMAQGFESMIEEVDRWLQGNTTDIIRSAVVDLLRLYRTAIDEKLTAPHFGRLVHQQLPLGSRAFFAGVWRTYWKQEQEDHLKIIRSQRSASLWLNKLLQKIQVIPINMWDIRNNILHNSADNSLVAAQQGEMNSIIEEIFQTKPHTRLMAHCDKAYFAKHTKEQVKAMKIQRKTNWITGANLILTKYERATTEQSSRFTSYFQWDRG